MKNIRPNEVMRELLDNDEHFNAINRIMELMESNQTDPVIIAEIEQLAIIIESYEEARQKKIHE